MKKTRILQRVSPDGRTTYTIQQKHFIFFWWWVDAWINSTSGAACQDTWDTYEEALANLCYFDGSKTKEKVMHHG